MQRQRQLRSEAASQMDRLNKYREQQAAQRPINFQPQSNGIPVGSNVVDSEYYKTKLYHTNSANEMLPAAFQDHEQR